MKKIAGMAFCLSLLATTALAETVVVTASKMVEVETGKVINNPVLVITDGRITASGQKGDIKVPKDAKTVDLPGVTLVPGLIDMHVHIDTLAEVGGYNYLQYTDSFWAVVGAHNADVTLKAGFTTVRNVGSYDYNDVGLSQAIDAGIVQGPRIIPSGYAFGATGGHCDETFLPPSFDKKNALNADNPEEGIKSVRILKKYGARVIKICATGGVFDAGHDPGEQQMTVPDMKAIVNEAHMSHLKVAAHAHGADGIKAAILAGVDTIEHASLVDDEGIKLAVEHGTYFAMDIYNTDYTQAEGAKNGVLASSLKKDADLGEVQRQNYKKALKAGVKMVFGTDAGIYPHGDNAKQFKIMVRYGATPLQALQSATVTAADALDMEADVGSLKVGHYGDVVGVMGDPLTDITVLEKPVFVMKGGTVVRNEVK